MQFPIELRAPVRQNPQAVVTGQMSQPSPTWPGEPTSARAPYRECSATKGIVVPSVGNTVVSEVLAGANTVLEDAGFQPVIGVSYYDPKREEKLIESIFELAACRHINCRS
jgi:hypothetical protein